MRNQIGGTMMKTTGFGLLLIGALGIVGMASAQPAAPAGGTKKYTKQETEVTGVAQTNLTKPAPPPKEKKASGPTISLDQFIEKKQGQIQKITDAQITQIQRLIRITGDDDVQKPDFLFRLGEMHAEKQRYYNFQARSLDQKIFDAAPGAKASLTRQQTDYDKQSEKWLLEAVKSYAAARTFKQYDRMDEVLFRLAYLLQTVKREDQAREVFHQLIKDYPNSKYVPEAFLSFAEYYFGKGEMDNALKFYKKVEEFPKSPVYGYAIYKQGWCFINLGDFKTALKVFVDVIAMAKSGRGGDKRQNAALEREAKKDVVKAYARVGTPDKAWEFFSRVGGDFAPKMLEALGEFYWEQGQFKDSTIVYNRIISLNPDSPRVCEWQNKVVRNTLSVGTKKDQVQQLQRLGLAYTKVSKMQNAKKDVIDECKNSYHDTTRELALIWHKEAQRTKNPDTYELTKYVYKEYLDHFGKEKGSYELNFYYAEVLFTRENWKEAADQYTRVVEMNPDPNAKYLKEAAYAAVISWKNALSIADSGEGPDRGHGNDKELKARPLPEFQKKMIGAFDTYIKYVPNAPELVKIKYRKARIYYDYNHFEDATPLFQEIVDKHPGDELAIYSANLLLDSLNVLHKTKQVIALVDKFLKVPELMKDQEFRTQMVLLKTDSMVAEAKRYEAEKNFKECGVSMEQAADSLPTHPKHAERLYDAGLCYTNARLIGQAIRLREALIKDHPKDPLAQKAQFQIASGYQQLASYTKAAEYFEAFATKFPGEKEAATALGNATVYRMGLDDYKSAVEDMNTFIKLYGSRKPQEAANVFFQMAQVYDKQGKADELLKHYQEYLKRWGAQGGVDKQMVAHFLLGLAMWKRSCPSEGVNGACIEVKRVTATGRQKALYEYNKKIKDKKKKLKDLRTQCGPPTKSKITVLDRKKNLVVEAQKHFKEVLKLWAGGAAAKKVPGATPAEQQARIGLAQNAVAGSMMYGAEGIYEDFLRVKFPEGLDFQAPTQFDSKAKAAVKKKKLEESNKKFLAYLETKTKLAEKLTGPSVDKKGLYDFVLDHKVAHWTIAASARIGQVYANFVDQLYTAEIPKDLKEQDEWGNRPREIFCDALVDKAEPIEAKAVSGYGLCLKAATKESWFNEWSTLCEQELNQMQPTEFPLASESKPEWGYVPTLMTPATVMTDLPERANPTLSHNQQ